MYQPRRHLSQIHTNNYTPFIREKPYLLKKKFVAKGGGGVLWICYWTERPKNWTEKKFLCAHVWRCIRICIQDGPENKPLSNSSIKRTQQNALTSQIRSRIEYLTPTDNVLALFLLSNFVENSALSAGFQYDNQWCKSYGTFGGTTLLVVENLSLINIIGHDKTSDTVEDNLY